MLRSPPWPPLRMYVLTIETERGAAAKVLGRTGSEGVRGMFREQSWKCCLWVTVNRCKPNFRGSGVYVPRSIDWHPASRCIISLLLRITDGNQVAPLTREHPRRRYTPVDTPWRDTPVSKGMQVVKQTGARTPTARNRPSNCLLASALCGRRASYHASSTVCVGRSPTRRVCER